MGRPRSSAGHQAGRGITLDITQEIINAAIPRDSSHCVIADALQQAVPDARYVSVDLQTVRFTDPATARRYVYLTPAPAQSILVNFDQGKMPEPQVMRLGRPAQIVKSGHRGNSEQRAVTDPKHPEMPTGDKKVVRNARRGGQPEVLGGKLPPSAALSNRRGRRRTFGIRSMRP